mgnify:FL=1
MKKLLKCSGLVIFTYLYVYFICYIFDDFNGFAEMCRLMTEFYITTLIVGCLMFFLNKNELL